jgi:hypothetical protein
MLVFDSQTEEVVDVNPAACREYGYTRAEFLGMTMRDLRPASERARHRHLETVRGTEGPTLTGPWNHQRADGSVFQVEIAAHGLEGSRPQLRLATVRRLSLEAQQLCSARAEVQAEIQEQEAFYRSIFDNAHDGILLYDLDDDTVFELNARAAEMLESTPSALRGHRLATLGLSAEILAGLAELRERDSVLVEAGESADHGAPPHLEIRATRMEYRGRQVGLCIIRDLTEQLQLQTQLKQAQRLESIGRLAGGVAHDFNNLITAIQGFATILQDGIADEAVEHVEAVTEIIEASRRAHQLTRQLLAYSRQQRLDPEPLDLNELIRSTQRMLARLIGEDIDVGVELDPDLHAIHADAGQIQQVLMNLVVNARDAMPDGGRLTLETRNVDVEADHAANHPGGFEPGTYVRLAVADTGVGMETETLAQVFDPFFTTKPTGEGTGLGLSTVYGIVKQSGGFIWAYSEPGIGTTFRLYFPITDLRPTRAPEALSERGAPLQGEGRTVLVVEDERPVRSLVCKALESRGFRVLEAESGSAALDAVEGRLDSVDLVITDMVMPGISGIELAGRIRHARPGIPVLFMSGYSREFLVEKGDLAGHHRILEKPFTPGVLLDKTRRIIDAEPEPGPELEPLDWKHQLYAE